VTRNARAHTGQHRPRYSEIEDILRQEIQTGVYRLGTRLPTEHELCERFGVSRFTVRQALSRLREAGILDARPGIGTIVVSSADRVTFVHTLSSMEELLLYPAETDRQHISVQRIEAMHAGARGSGRSPTNRPRATGSSRAGGSG
jgi:DNA-binding GntR family transcriptional regulator